MLDELDLQQNPIMTQVLQAVGVFGDILSLKDMMEPVLSVDGRSSEREKGSGEADEETTGGSEHEQVMEDEEKGHSETFECGGIEDRVTEGDNTDENGKMEERKVEEEDENKGWEVNKEVKTQFRR